MSALDEVRDLAESVARRRSLRLWDVEMGGQPGRSIVRVLVDAEGGSISTPSPRSRKRSRVRFDLNGPDPRSLHVGGLVSRARANA